jgi:hypothetical protein
MPLAERVETRSRLVEEKNPRIERERSCQCGAFDHAAGKLGGN